MAEFIIVARTSDVAPGSVKYVEIKGHRIALCNADGEFYAISDVCTHDFGPLDQGELDGYQIECPRHGARFDIRSGVVITLPAVLPLDTYPVRVVGDEVQVGV
jgi:3-phenylpropionate/trans-cinnamate dioxygenase ferredoxin subunit